MSPADRWLIQCTEDGASTQVYRLQRDGKVFYLRVAESGEAGLAPEVYAHQLLRKRGVRVPDVVYFEPLNERLQRSIMIMTAVEGEAVGKSPVAGDTATILQAAGRDLALINSVPVLGFGWIRRGAPAVDRLEAEHVRNRDFALEQFDAHLVQVGEKALRRADVAAIRSVVARHAGWLDLEQAWLAHGDFDLTHIYQQDGHYTGIIDFGELRGADRLYDLGHFNLHDGEMQPLLVLPSLLAGHGSVVRLPSDHEQRICFLSVLIGVRALALALGRPHAVAYQLHLTAAIRRSLAQVT